MGKEKVLSIAAPVVSVEEIDGLESNRGKAGPLIFLLKTNPWRELTCQLISRERAVTGWLSTSKWGVAPYVLASVLTQSKQMG